MTVDSKWAERNIGFNPIRHPATQAVVFPQAGRPPSDQELQREIIDFDSEAPAGMQFLAFTKATGLSRFTDIEWPSGWEPRTDKTVRKGTGGRLPKADVIVVTWTVDEGHALSRVLTPEKDSRNDYIPYTRNFAAISKKMVPDCPARKAHRLGAYWTTTIGGKRVVVFKSDSHMSQDGPELPNIDVWTQIIQDVQPKFVMTTGTSGGIGKEFEVGDVVVSPIVRFDCIKKFKKEPFHAAHYSSSKANTKNFAKAKALFKFNSGQLPPDNKRPPKIVTVSPNDLASSVVTTDFFGFDTTNNEFKLQGMGDVCEMGDAVLGLVVQQMKARGETVPTWLVVRNVSDPQIKDEGNIQKEKSEAGEIYKAFGRWSSVCSAIVCCALIA